MIRRPPRSTLFPCSTLYRPLAGRPYARQRQDAWRTDNPVRLTVNPPKCRPRGFALGGTDRIRSEEHTSELQSHSDLVCRLLLGKKKSRLIVRVTSRARALSV